MNRRSPLIDGMESDILRYIAEKKLTPGDRLPALSELSNELNISVSKLREQLEVARILGAVEVRPRTGIRCREFEFMPALRLGLFYMLAQDRRMFDLYSNLRIHVEVAYWHEATQKLQAEDMQTLRGLMASAWQKLRGDHIIIPYQEHRQFHMGIFSRLEHPFVKGVLDAYWEAYEAVELHSYADYAYLEKVWTYHEKIIDEIADGNFDASLNAFVEHTRLLPHQPNSQVKPSEYYGTMTVKGNQTES